MSAETLRRWRETYERQREIGHFLETVAVMLELEDLPFEVHYSSWPASLDWDQDGWTLQQFAEACKEVGRRLGKPPDRTSTAHIWSGYDSVPDLSATWNMRDAATGRDFDVRVYAKKPSGCKLDPRVVPIPAVPAKQGVEAVLHPECMGVLKSLEDTDPRA